MILPTVQCREAANSLAVKAAINGISACAPVDSGIPVTLNVCASENTIWLAFINQIKVAFCYIFGILTSLQTQINSIHGMRTPGAVTINPGAGLGAGGIASIVGNDTAGQIILTTGTGSGPGEWFSLNFLTPYATAGILHLEGADQNGSTLLASFALGNTTTVSGSSASTGGSIGDAATATLNYVVLGGT
jgi:hypothetical protein